MIKVIASDMDGTLLGNDHKVAPETLKAIHEACDAGIRFMIATGRNFKGAMEELKETDIVCDYIVGSGAEVRDQKQQIVSTAPLSMELCEEIYENLKEFPVSIIFSSGDYDYRIGTKKEIEEIFDWTNTNPYLQKKAERINEIYKHGTPLEKKIASVFLETFLFYSGFYTPLYYLGNNKLANVAEIIKLIIRDESVHGTYIGYKFQLGFNELPEAEQETLKDWMYNLLYELYETKNVIQKNYTIQSVGQKKSKHSYAIMPTKH